MLIQTNFIAGKMNKSVDERLVPVGEYVDALNVRLGSTETTEIGAVENSRGNTGLTVLEYLNNPISQSSRCIGVYEDGMEETLYWFVHDPANPVSASGKVDLIVSFNVNTGTLIYHLVSETILNFDPQYLITGVSKIGDLLFFTDDKNPPRYINRTGQNGSNYPSDAPGTPNPLIEEDISVIVKPPGFENDNTLASTEPLGAPYLELENNNTSEDYMEGRFLCFAYRYRYIDGGYSATSLFTNPAFEPKEFNFSLEKYQNDGMVNQYNQVKVYFSTGSKRVTEIQLLYKETTSNNIYVVDRINKADLGIPSDTFINRTFNNQKILTVLGSDELLRLYDNVPKLAKAQTIQGNRLMYGNYVDQYDILNHNGNVINPNYSLQPISTNFGAEDIPVVGASTVNYSVDPIAGQSVGNARITFDFSVVPNNIAAGTVFSLQFVVQQILAVDSSPVTPGADFVSTLLPDFNVIFTFTAPVNYATPQAMVTSADFLGVVGTAASIVPLLPSDPIALAAAQTTTDRYNNQLATINAPISANVNTLELFNSAITGQCPAAPIVPNPPVTAVCTQEPWNITATPGNLVSFTLTAPQYYFDDGLGNPDSVTNQFNYYNFKVADCQGSYTTTPDTGSLHSDRDFEVGIVYMDEFARASTVLTSPTDTVYFSPRTMTTKNKIQVNLENEAPFWAEKYKFVVKPSQGDYNTIYCNMVYQQTGGNSTGGTQDYIADLSSWWFRLEGDAQNLVKVGDQLTVKMDAIGSTGERIVTEVLDKEALYSQQIASGSQAGLYMRLKPTGWQPKDPNAPENILCSTTKTNSDSNTGCGDACDVITSCGVNDAGTAAPISAGSSIYVKVRNRRGGGGGSCNDCEINWSKRLQASQNYTSIHACLVGEQFSNMVNDNTATTVDEMDIYFDPALYGDATQGGNGLNKPGCSCFNSALYVYVNAAGEQFIRNTGAIPFCWDFWPFDGEKATFHLKVEISFSPGIFCFESETQTVDPNLFYDASELLDVNILPNGTRLHNATTKFNPTLQNELINQGCQDGLGNSIPCQDQGIGTPLRTVLDFKNCYVFGNGVESFRIEDRIDAKSFDLGSRFLAVSNQDFKEADRFSGMTYSGVFSDSANSNNLNEFNLGLVNYKDLESTFGPIMKMYSRETDILILQEDRISYVLSGKNVVTDSTGGGAIVSVPEVLGQQIARIEEFGISFNPESFASWGASMFFTDTKRGAVLMLQGASSNSDQLTEISSFGMRSYFRDEFNAGVTLQKLGGYDPYMDEYVLSSNDIGVPMPLQVIPCGQAVTQSNAISPLEYEVDLGSVIGPVTVTYQVNAPLQIEIQWPIGTQITSFGIATSGSATFQKTASTPSNAKIILTPINPSTQPVDYTVTMECPEEQSLQLIEVVVNTTNYFGESIHTEFNWDDIANGGSSYSPLPNMTAVNLNNSNPTSYYNSTFGVRSVGVFPYSGADITLRTRKISPDTFDFNPAIHKFRILSSNTLYNNTPSDIASLLAASSVVTGITNPSPGVYQSTEPLFNMPLANNKLYLIWDLRDVVNAQLCYSDPTLSAFDACCNCDNPCTKCEFGPQTSSFGGACLTDVTDFGSASYSFNNTGSIPVLGDTVFSTPINDCNPLGGYVAAGFYIVSPVSPSVLPKQWVQIGANGVVIDSGTC